MSAHSAADRYPCTHFGELARLDALRRLRILDTPPEERFDRLVRLVASVFGVPIAKIALIDESRVWSKASVGVSQLQLPRAGCFCDLVLRGQGVLAVTDAEQDSDRPEAMTIRRVGASFAAGCAIHTANGHPVGVLMVMDTEPRVFEQHDQSRLSSFASLVAHELESRLDTLRVTEQEKKLSQIVEHSPLGLICAEALGAGLERSFGVTELNGIAASILGVERATAIGADVAVCGALARVPGLQEDLERAVSDGEHIRRQVTWNDRRLERVFDLTILPQNDGVIITLLDLTDHVAAQRELRASRESLQVAVQGGELGLWDLDIRTGRLRCNDRFHTMLGRKPSTPVIDFQVWRRIVHQDDVEGVLDALEAYLTGKADTYDIVYRMAHEDGSWVWIASRGAAVERGHDGVPLRVAGIHADVTARRENESRLRVFSFSVDQLHDTLLWADASGRIVFANQTAETMLGWSREELASSTIAQLDPTIEPDDWAHYWDSMQAEGFVAFESRQTTRDGREFPTEWRGHRIDFEGEAFACFTVRDVAEQRRDQARMARYVSELIEAQRTLEARSEALAEASARAEDASRAKGQFLANMSHEIRTPLNGVVGMIDLLRRSGLDEKQARYASVARSSAQALRALVDDVLDFSKIEVGRIELERIPFSLCELVSEVCDMIRPEVDSKGVSIRSSVHPDVPIGLIGDPTRIRQVLTNLINNAVKFTASGGVVVRCVVDRFTAENVEIRISVNDTGIGIPADRLDKLFQPFSQVDASTTRRFGGTGLGLAICRELVTLMGGAIGVESSEGEGSTFWFTVPLGLTQKPAESGTDIRRLRIRALFPSHGPAAELTEALCDFGVHCGPLDLECDELLRTQVVLTTPELREEFEQVRANLRQDEADCDTSWNPVVITIGPKPGPGARKDPGLVDESATPNDLLAAIVEAVISAERLPVGLADDNSPGAIAELEASLDGKRILLAEDNEINRQVATELLSQSGVQVTVAVNGDEAVEAVRAAGREPFHAVLMDCQMPVMDGYEATGTIRDLERAGEIGKTPVIALTANATSGDRQACINAGMDDYLSKPLERDLLLSTLCKHINADPSAGSNTPSSAHQRPASCHRNAPVNQTSEHHPVSDEGDLPRPSEFDVEAMLNRCMGQAGLAAKLLRTFAEQTPGALNGVVDALAEHDLESVRRAAHALKGSAATMAATDVAECARLVESLAQAGDPANVDEIREAVESLRRSVDACLEAIPQLIASRLQASDGQEGAGLARPHR